MSKTTTTKEVNDRVVLLKKLLKLLPAKYCKVKFVPQFKAVLNIKGDGNFDKIGGIPSIDMRYLNKNGKFTWPICGLCKNNLKFIFQLSVELNKILQLFMCTKCFVSEFSDKTKYTTCMRFIQYKNCVKFSRLGKYYNKNSDIPAIIKYAYNYYRDKELVDSRNCGVSFFYKIMEKNGNYKPIDWAKDSTNKQLQCYRVMHYDKRIDLNCKYNLFKIISKFETARLKKGLIPWLCVCNARLENPSTFNESILDKLHSNKNTEGVKEILKKRYTIKPTQEKDKQTKKPIKIEEGTYTCQCFQDILHEHILNMEDDEFVKIGGIGTTSNSITYKEPLISFIESRYIPYQWGDSGSATITKDLRFVCEY